MARKRSRFFQFPWRSRSQIDRDVDTELEFHLEMRVSELLAEGLTTEQASAHARREFGDVEFTRAYCRDVDRASERSKRTADRLGELGQDISYTLRTLRRNPGFAIVSIITLALAIGANTAIFSVAQAVLLKPLPYGHPESLVAFYEVRATNPDPRQLSAPNIAEYRMQQHSLTGLAVYYTRPSTWRTGDSDPRVVRAMRVSANMFDILGVRALLGRAFVAGDDASDLGTKVVLSYQFWRHELGGDPNVIGRKVELNNTPYDVIGVMPRGVNVDESEDVWIPFDMSGDLAHASITRKQYVYEVIGRLKPGITLDAARADLEVISKRMGTEFPDINGDLHATVAPLQQIFARNVKQPVLLLLGAALLILLIACANLTNVTLSRAMSRRGEMAVRAALGAGRARLVRQLLTESLLLSMAGGGIGVALAVIGTRALLAINPYALPGIFDARVDGRVLAFSVAVAIGTGVLFGLAPAIAASRADLHDALKDRGRGGTGGRVGERIRRGLVVAQVGLTVMLLIGAGLLVRSFREITTVRLGYDPSNVLTAQLRVDGASYDSSTVVNQFYDRLFADLIRVPGVVAAGAVMQLPSQGQQFSGMYVEGSSANPNRLPDIAYTMVRGEYFRALRIPIVAGRIFSDTDLPDGAKVAMINESAARLYFPKGNAVGSRVRIGPNPAAPWVTIVGVVGDMRDGANWRPPAPTIYDNARQQTWWTSLSIVIRTSGDPAAAAPMLRSAVRTADPSLALRDVATLDEMIGQSLSTRRFALGIAACFAVLALVLAAVGIYGVLAYSVTARTREFGVRLALGATVASVVGLVVRQGLGWSIAGLAIGIGGALAFGKVLASSLFGITASDPFTFAAVSCGLIVIVLIACIVPAARATRVDPIDSLRAE
jgi:predicted permease